jgi:pilus assembly protein CpaF
MPMRSATWPAELKTALRPIMDHIEDDGLTDIAANAHDRIFVKGASTHGQWHLAEGCGWDDPDHFRNGCIRISDGIGRSVNSRHPLLDARLPSGERVNVVMAPVCATGAVTIRRFPTQTMTLERLERLGTLGGPGGEGRACGQEATDRSPLPTTVRELIECLVWGRASVVVTGSTGAGKTSLLNAMTGLVSPTERIVTVENARELQIRQPNWVSLETVEPIFASEDAIPIGALVRNTLRQTPDRIIVGEVRGSDSLDLLRALSTGHRGGFSTVHANGAVDALLQLQLLALMGETPPPAPVVAQLIGRAIDVVVHCEFWEGDWATRAVAEIIEVDSGAGVESPSNSGEFRVRTLLDHRQLFPEMPSERMLRIIELGQRARAQAAAKSTEVTFRHAEMS